MKYSILFSPLSGLAPDFPPEGARESVVVLSFPAPFGGRMSVRTGRGHKMLFINKNEICQS